MKYHSPLLVWFTHEEEKESKEIGQWIAAAAIVVGALYYVLL